MKAFTEFNTKEKLKVIFCDIDDTLTTDGKLEASAYNALWRLKENNFKVVPITGRPAGWCEMIARFFPVDGVVGENGAFYFRYQNQKMNRYFAVEENQRLNDRKKLDEIIAPEILSTVKGSALASDQFCRLMDLAIDFCEDVKPLDKNSIEKIVEVFKKHGAQAKVSSIHVNGWFGEYDKLSTCKVFAKKELSLDLDKKEDLNKCLFIGDSPNDEPMFKFFNNSFAVANIKNFLDQLEHKPTYLMSKPAGHGFVELTEYLIG